MHLLLNRTRLARAARWSAAALLACALRSGAGEQAQGLSLEACYERALDRSERVGVAAAEWRAAEARYRQARDTLLPAVRVAGSASFQNDRRSGQSDSAGRAPEAYGVGLYADQVLYGGFRSTRLAEAREAEGRAAQFDERRTREVLYLDVSDAFHELLLRERDAILLRRLEAALEESVAALEERVRLGRSRTAELLNARTDLAEARVEQEAVNGQADAAREVLSFLVDLPADEIRLQDPGPFPASPDVQTRLEAAGQRADVQAGEARVEAAQRDLQAVRGERQPEIAAGGSVNLYEDPDEDRAWSVALTMSLPLFDEGVIRSRARERAEHVRISELDLAALRRSAARDVRTAFAAFRSAAAQRASLDEACGVARENYDLQKRDYEMGRASQLDALTALAQWQRLERRASAADVQARASLVRLHVAAGGAQP